MKCSSGRWFIGMLLAASWAVASQAEPLGFNFDFGTAFAGVTPDASYAAAGQAGYWNAIAPDSRGEFGEFELFDLAGNERFSTLILEGSSPRQHVGELDFFFSGRTDGEALLMGDYVVSFEEVQILGLPAGDYRVTAYAANHAGEPYPGVIDVMADTQSSITLGGVFVDGLNEGQTHGSTVVRLTNPLQDVNAIRIVAGTAGDPFLQGLQIVAVPEPVSCWLLGGVWLAATSRRRR